MNNAKSNLIKWSISATVIWITLLITGFIIENKNLISHVSFGLSVFCLIDPLILFFQSKSLKNKDVTKIDIKNYLSLEEINSLKKKSHLLNKKINKRKYGYRLSFAFGFAILFIGLSVILIYL